MEYCDIYDEHKKPLGIIRARKDNLLPGEFKLAVGVWVINENRELLLTKRHPNKNFAPNLWENTGGHVMAGERVTTSAVRELEEEIGIAAKEEELIYIGCAKVSPYFGENYALHREVPVEEVILQEGETCEAKWVTYEEFHNMIHAKELSPATVEHFSFIRNAFETILLGKQ